MDCNEDRFQNSCNPAFIQINGKLDQLLKTVCIGNGTPSLLSRVSVLETRAELSTDGKKDSKRRACGGKTVRLFGGAVELDGYNLSDVMKAGLAVGMIYVLMQMHFGKTETDAKIRALLDKAPAGMAHVEK
jgi:hypothetical protein